MKIFCIGRNKTGTTSLRCLFHNLGYTIGKQRDAELLFKDYKKQRWGKIIEYCETTDFFQDSPFSYPGICKPLDKAFPNSKFILSVRDSPEEWYRSLIKSQSRLFGQGKIPTEYDLKRATYVYIGWAWDTHKYLYNSPNRSLYHKDTLINHYINHNKEIREYFKDRPNDFIEINLANKDDFPRLIAFLGIKTQIKKFPWKNKGNNKLISPNSNRDLTSSRR